MYIISFDVGIINLAYTIINIDTDETNIEMIEWENLDIRGMNVGVSASKICLNSLCEGLIQEMNDNILSRDEYYDIILIENQIGPKAQRMKVIQHYIAMFFMMNGYSSDNIINYSSSNKLSLFDLKKSKNYNENKKRSRNIVKEICNGDNCFNVYKDKFNKSKKKDDLADCFLQCLHYMFKHKYIDKEFINSLIDKEFVEKLV